jgi:hypothetical protein
LDALKKPRKEREMKKSVIVTTQHRGVFYGVLNTDEQPESDRTLILNNCRNAIYWAGSRGFLGLASDGPEKGSRVGSTAPRVVLHDVTSVSDCTPKAAQAWEGWK